jgi:hypothetical protein
MSKLKDFLVNIWNWIERVFHNLPAEYKRLVPIAYDIVSNIMKVENSGALDLLTQLIPGNLDDKLNEWLKKLIPEVLLSLGVGKDLPEVVDYIKSLTGNQKIVFLSGLNTLFTHLLSDGNFSVTDAQAVQAWFHKYRKDLEAEQPVFETAVVNKGE